MPIHLHQGKSENIYTILYSVAYFIHTYRNGAVWNLQIPKKIEYFKNLLVCTISMNMHNFNNMFATIFIPMWTGGWTRRYSEDSPMPTRLWSCMNCLSLEFSLHNHYSTLRHAQNQMTTLCQKACSACLSPTHIYFLFDEKKTYSGWSWPHMTICSQMARHTLFLFFSQTLSILHKSFISLSIPSTLSSFIKCYFLF